MVLIGIGGFREMVDALGYAAGDAHAPARRPPAGGRRDARRLVTRLDGDDFVPAAA